VIAEFRAKGGRGITNFGDRLLLLTTRGAKTGQPRVAPPAYTQDGDRFVVIASKGGALTHPDWYHNVIANPEVEIEVGSRRLRARARRCPTALSAIAVCLAGEREARLLGVREKTNRTIPIVVLEPIADSLAA
jgi:deazaflavin-dependent oxidoreductase (nitroreductase family)